ncbi:hypothetical protein RV11_GL000754 [Enterococcus phoeniculicola]|nr:hypothetical protein RV11_GL000754 [Enterococcus phoeniculicola]
MEKIYKVKLDCFLSILYQASSFFGGCLFLLEESIQFDYACPD